MSKIALIDFKDSFTFTIYHYLRSFTDHIEVLVDGDFELDYLVKFDKIIFSPGPGLPSETKMMAAILDRFSEEKTILGICLGLQGIVEFFGGSLYNQVEVKHGVKTRITLAKESPLFRGLPKSFEVGLYHSWACAVPPDSALDVLALSQNDVVMAVQHNNFPIFGVQFHPESILTDYGKEIVSNFVYL